ncbi:MAG: hypothetical protein Pars92KO_28320 [Parasphingorhabdus sp.]
MNTRNERIFAFIIVIIVAAGLANFLIFDIVVFGLSAKTVMALLNVLGSVSFVYLVAKQKRSDS